MTPAGVLQDLREATVSIRPWKDGDVDAENALSWIFRDADIGVSRWKDPGFLAWDGETVVGGTFCHITDTTVRTYDFDIAVLDAYRGQRIGARLIDTSLKDAKSRSDIVYVTVVNAAVASALGRRGFALEDKADGEWTATLDMRKPAGRKEPVKARYYGTCRELHDQGKGKEVKTLVNGARKMTWGRFRARVDVYTLPALRDYKTSGYDVSEAVADFMADDAGSGFYCGELEGETVFFIQTKGFEFIFK